MTSVSFADELNGWITGDSGMVLRTTDGGLTFIQNLNNDIPGFYSLSQNYPNPFNPVTKVKFQIPKSSFVKLIIYDLLGREITTLVNQQFKPGTYEADWDATNYPSGVYFYKLITDEFIETKKMVLIK